MTYKKYMERITEYATRLGFLSAAIFLAFSLMVTANRAGRPVLSGMCLAAGAGFIVALATYCVGMYRAPDDDTPEVIPANPSPIKPVPSTPVPAVPIIEAKTVASQEDPVRVEQKPKPLIEHYLAGEGFKIGTSFKRIPTDKVSKDHLNNWLVLVRTGQTNFTANSLDTAPDGLRVSRHIKAGSNAWGAAVLGESATGWPTPDYGRGCVAGDGMSRYELIELLRNGAPHVGIVKKDGRIVGSGSKETCYKYINDSMQAGDTYQEIFENSDGTITEWAVVNYEWKQYEAIYADLFDRGLADSPEAQAALARMKR